MISTLPQHRPSLLLQDRFLAFTLFKLRLISPNRRNWHTSALPQHTTPLLHKDRFHAFTLCSLPLTATTRFRATNVPMSWERVNLCLNTLLSVTRPIHTFTLYSRPVVSTNADAPMSRFRGINSTLPQPIPALVYED